MYHPLTKIAKGGYATIYHDKDKKYAIKQYPLFKITKFRCSIRAEVDFLTRTSHPNIVKIHDIFIDNGMLHLVMDLEQTNLEDYLTFNILGEELKVSLSKQFVQAMRYIHGNDYLHGDLKIDNILITNGILKICDFNKIRYFEAFNEKESRDDFIGSIVYRAPELLGNTRYLKLVKKDILFPKLSWDNLLKAERYCVGRVLYDIVTNSSDCTVTKLTETLEISSLPYLERVNKIREKSRLTDERLISLIGHLMVDIPDERINICSILLDEIRLDQVLCFNIEHPHHLNAIKVGASAALLAGLRPYEFSQALEMYYNLFPYGLSYNGIDTSNRPYMIMATSILLGCQPTSYDTQYVNIYNTFKRYFSKYIFKSFSEDAYLRVKGVITYDHIGNYTKQYGGIGTWLALKYYIHQNGKARKINMAKYVESLSIQVESTLDCLIMELPKEVFDSIFI